MKNTGITIILTLVVVAGIWLWRNCQETEVTQINHSMTVMRIEELGKLEVVKYNIQDMVEYNKVRKWLPNSKTALIAAGEVVGCIDLAKLTPLDVTINDDSISVWLPAPEICYCKIDHQRSQVYDVQYGWWETAELVDEAYRFAESQLLIEAQRMGIETDSKRNAEKVVATLLRTFGYKKVSIHFKAPIEQIPEQERYNNMPSTLDLKNL